MHVPFAYNIRSMWVRRATTLATVGGVALVVFVLASSQMLVEGLRATLGVSGRQDRALVLQQNAYAEPSSRLRQSVLNVAATGPNVRHASDGRALVTGEALVQFSRAKTGDPSHVVSLLVRGVSANVTALRSSIRILQGHAPTPGTDEAMLGSQLVNHYEGLQLGGSFELKAGRKIAIVGVFDAAGSAQESEIWMDLDALRTSLSWEGFLSSITVQLGTASDFPEFARELDLQTNGEAVAERESEYYVRISRGLSSMIGGLGALIATIFSLGAMLGCAITMYSSVGQRVREIGVFRSLGFKRAHILTAFLLEAFALALAGATLGAALALLASLGELAMVNAATSSEIIIHFEPTVPILLVSIVAGGLVGMLGGLFPSLRAARLNPLEALRG